MKSKVLLLIAGLVLVISLVLVGCNEVSTGSAGAQGEQASLAYAYNDSQQAGI